MNHIKKLKGLHKKLKSVIREYVLLRDKDICSSCGVKIKSPHAKQVGHLVHKSESGAVYYDEANQNLQCFRCNINLRGNTAAYAHYVRLKWGYKTLIRLLEAGYSKKTHQWSEDEITALIGLYNQKLEALKKV